MKKLSLVLMAFVLAFAGVISFGANHGQAADTEASIDLQLSSTQPAVGDTITVLVTITNTDSVPHVLGAQVGYAAQVSSFSCHPGATFFSGLQFATYAPGESHTYTTTLIAPAPGCVPNNQYVIYARAQDHELAGNPIVGTTSTNFTVQ